MNDKFGSMSLGIDVRRAFRNSVFAKPGEGYRPNHFVDSDDSKARHILGLDTADVVPARNNSTSSTSTTKLPSVTFSDATTAAVSTSDTAETLKKDHSLSGLNRKGSSVLLKRPHDSELLEPHIVKQQVSDSSLRSFYDRNRAPLSISQQTSDSSIRDLGLRMGVPSIISTSSQEKNRSKQSRFFSRSKKSQQGDDQIRPETARPSTKASSRSLASSMFDARSHAGESVALQQSLSHVSATKTATEIGATSAVPANDTAEREKHFLMAEPTADPARAKVNVRRPKAGAKNWFDSIDSESSDGDENTPEPQLYGNFPVEVKAPLTGNLRYPPRSSSRTPTNATTNVLKPQTSQQFDYVRIEEPEELTPTQKSVGRGNKRKVSRFAHADLTQESVLSLTSSEDESEDDRPVISDQELARMEIRASLMNQSWNESDIVLGQALTVDPRDASKTSVRPSKKTPPQRVSSRMMTYLDDRSSETTSQHSNLITAFPRTPSDTASRGTSVRESVLSEDESIISTKQMTVTRQEEHLIAAMRRKKTAMKKAQAMAHREGALKLLELENNNHAKGQSRRDPCLDRFSEARTSNSPLRLTHLASPRTQRQFQRPESGTTIQTDSIQGHSVRSSNATYLSEGSEDLQYPYSSMTGLPAHRVSAPTATDARPQQVPRGTFLSDETTRTVDNPPEDEWDLARRSSSRVSHVVVLDPLDRQLLREDIPSQLFLEHPFIGWDARANMQAAH